ncbi:MAG: sugar phosphate isomerase/epimerase [Candidatus Omnitrophota bacterium]|jgi:sugar phosphate isomerase/epimerase|nr:MAG: sugar phosphate isomerase/epimerase [Candidatus Omnitrophota bacterium]
MNKATYSRRKILTASSLAVAASLANPFSNAANSSSEKSGHPGRSGFAYCLNTGTIRGQKLGLVKEIEVTAQAGYDAIEPWLDSIYAYVKNGGSLSDLRKRLEDLHLTVESAITFSQWVVDDDAERAKGWENMKRDMDALAQIGGTRIAAAPAGATNQPGLDLLQAAERYRALLELGDQMGVVPQLEIWGGSKNLHRMGQAVYVAMESGHPNACLLFDIFHIYKGGGDFHGLKLLRAEAMHVFHMNDYPADPPRETIGDGDRVFPGDGVAPVSQILRDIHATGGRTVLSLELFNRAYWQQDALDVAKTGLAKMKKSVEKALA